MPNRILSKFVVAIPKNEKIVLFNTKNAKTISIPESIYTNGEYLENRLTYNLLQKEEFLEDKFEIYNIKNNNLVGEKTLRIIILIHENCNFRCVYCYEKFKKGLIKEDVFKAICLFIQKELRTHKFKKLAVGWFGGEPLLGIRKIEQMSTQLIKLADEYKVEYISHITTNGYLLNRRNHTILQNVSVSDYQITIDGMLDYHDKQRKLINGQGTFKVIWNNLINLSKASSNFTVTIRANVSGENINNMNRLIDSFKKDFGNDKRFRLYFVNVNYWSKNNISTILKRDIRAELFEKAIAKNVSVMNMKAFINPCAICYAAYENSYVFGSDGLVYKCTVALYDKRNIIGKILNDGTVLISQSKHNLWLKDISIKENKKCFNCQILPICRGNQCPYKNIQKNTNVCPPTKKSLEKYIKIFLKQEKCDYEITF
ncbi:MAG: SPASM domain-containing protein [Bifidobacteriaceae bacterium]|jgi:uncharacterized protein|nr:SPASM domain-containing protein [Bifidobacteriaceae bacterium]